MTKALLRNEFIKIRKMENMHDGILNNLKLFLNKYQIIALYNPLPGEINVKPLIESLSLTKTICLPYCNPRLSFRRFYGFSEMTNDYFGISAPNSCDENINDIEAIVIPAVAMNFGGYRLGYGYGCYDKILSEYKGITIGIVLDSCLINVKFEEKHDIKLNYIITETKIVKVN